MASAGGASAGWESRPSRGSPTGRTRSKWQEDFEKIIEQEMAQVESSRRSGGARSRTSSIASLAGGSPEAVPPPRSPAPAKYTRVPTSGSSYMPGSSFATDAVAGGGRGEGNADNIEVLRSSLRGLAEVVTAEQAERRQLEDQVKMLMRANDECSSKLSKLQTTMQQRLDQVEDKLTTTDGEYKDAWGALENKVETYNDEVEDRVNQIAKTLVGASRDAKERSEAVEREFNERLDASAILIEEQAAKVDTRFATERKAVADKWDAVERNLAIRMEPLEARLGETRSSLTRMLEEANRQHDASRERQQKLLSEQTAKLRQQITEGNALITDRVEKSLSDEEEWVKKALEDVVQLLKRGNSNLKDEVSAVDKRCGDRLDEQAKTREASEARLKDEIKGARMELRELVKATKEDLERADSNQTTEINATIQTVADDLAYDLETNKHLLEAAEEGLNAKLIEEASARSSLEQDFTNKLGQSVHLLGNVIDGTKVELVEKLGTLSQKVDVDVKEQIANLETNFYERLDDLKTQVEDKVSKSTDEMSGKMDTMNVRIKKEMEPKLADTEQVARGAVAKLDTLETRVMLEQDELKTGMTKSLEEMGEELDELKGTVEGMTAGLDINMLLMGAASASGS